MLPTAHWTKDQFKMLYLGLAAASSFISYIMVIIVAAGWIIMDFAWDHRPKTEE